MKSGKISLTNSVKQLHDQIEKIPAKVPTGKPGSTVPVRKPTNPK